MSNPPGFDRQVSVRLVIDNEVVFDGKLDEWKAEPPERFKSLLNPSAAPEPWLKSIMVVMADAAMQGQSVNIEAVTGDTEWAIGVRYL